MNQKLIARKDVIKEDTWAIESMIKDEQEFDYLYQKITTLVEELEQMKGHILDDSSSFTNYLNVSNNYDKLMSKLYVYAHMNCDTDTKDSKKQAMKMKSEKLLDIASTKLSFITPEILKVDYNDILELLKQSNLMQYAFSFEQLFRIKEHILSEKEEKIVNLASTVLGTGEDCFYNLDNADAKFGTILNENNEIVEITTSNYMRFIQSSNREVRKNCFEVFYDYFEQHKNTFASTLRGNIKENFFFSNVRHYPNPLEMSLYSDNIDRKVYDNLIKRVHDHLPSMYSYMNLRKKILGVKELHMYDLYCNLVKNDDNNLSLDDGKKLVLEGLKPLGNHYLNDLKKGFHERWIDKYPNIGKKSGAYHWSSYDSLPFVFLNYDGTMDSVSTMAHELGHAMHTYYSNKYQDYIYHEYPIFLAEIASTVNEVLLNDYLYHNAKTKQEKILYLTDFLDKVRTTIFRQTMFSEFELVMHDKEEKGIPLTEQEFSDTYYELNKLYYGKNVVHDEKIRYEWARIPHFYTSFYVYKYATGLVSALSIASDILNGKENAKENYLKFLRSGGSNYPLEILKQAGVDITGEEPYQKAFAMFDNKLKELKELTLE